MAPAEDPTLSEELASALRLADIADELTMSSRSSVRRRHRHSWSNVILARAVIGVPQTEETASSTRTGRRGRMYPGRPAWVKPSPLPTRAERVGSRFPLERLAGRRQLLLRAKYRGGGLALASKEKLRFRDLSGFQTLALRLSLAVV